jgi:hypothetical protein
MPTKRAKTSTPTAEPCSRDAHGRLTDLEIWADTLGDDVTPWDTTVAEQTARGTTPSVPTKPSTPPQPRQSPRHTRR